MQKPIQKTALILTALLLTSCAGKRATVIDSATDVVRLGADVSGHVYVRGDSGEWELTVNKVTLPEGWFAASYKEPPADYSPVIIGVAACGLIALALAWRRKKSKLFSRR